ncbi:MAG: hypothetical protein QXK37_00110 [Candidatus Woesearchaeota archaeon]
MKSIFRGARHYIVIILAALSLLSLLVTSLTASLIIIVRELALIALFVVLIVLAVIIGWRKAEATSWVLLGLFFVTAFVNSFAVWMDLPEKSIVILLLFSFVNGVGTMVCIYGIVKSVASLQSVKNKPSQHREVIIDTIHPKKKNYVASIDGKTYHEPDCRLAKQIRPDKLIWFVNKGEAEEKKYTPCNKCIV